MKTNYELQRGGRATCISAEVGNIDTIQHGDGTVAICIVAGVVRSEGLKDDDICGLWGVHYGDSDDVAQQALRWPGKGNQQDLDNIWRHHAVQPDYARRVLGSEQHFEQPTWILLFA